MILTAFKELKVAIVWSFTLYLIILFFLFFSVDYLQIHLEGPYYIWLQGDTRGVSMRLEVPSSIKLVCKQIKSNKKFTYQSIRRLPVIEVVIGKALLHINKMINKHLIW